MAPRSPTEGSSRKWALGAAGALAVLLVAWLLWPGDGPGATDRAAPESEPEALTSHPGGPTQAIHRDDGVTPEGALPSPVGGDLIGDVSVDRDEICSGESALVSVETLGTEAQRRGYTVGVGAQNGNPVAVRLSNTGERTVIVRVTSPEGIIDREELTIRVRDCGARTPGHVLVDVESGRDASSFRFFARPNPNPHYYGGAVPRARWSYEWDLGDGTTEHTDVPILEHTYGDRDETTLLSSFPVRVRATAPGLEPIEGLTSVTIRNAFFENLQEIDVLSPQVSVDGTRRSGEDWLTDIHVRNPGDEAMEIERVHLGFVGCDPDVRFDDVDVPAARVLDPTTIPPGTSPAGLVTLSADLVPDGVCRMVVDLIGTGAVTGRPVRTSFGITLRRAPSQVLARGDVESAHLRTDLAQAFQVLGRDPRTETVSNRELEQLREQGLIGQAVPKPETRPAGPTRPRRRPR